MTSQWFTARSRHSCSLVSGTFFLSPLPTRCLCTISLLGDGSQWGINIRYADQQRPEGLAQAFVIGKNFIGQDPNALALGNNIFFGHEFPEHLCAATQQSSGATVFAHRVRDPERYAVIELDACGTPSSIDEKPARPRSHLALTGLYFYDNRVVDIPTFLRSSARGEYAITDVNRWYMEHGCLRVELLNRRVAWLDAGTHESLLQASTFIDAVETRQWLKACCPEEIAFRSGYINAEQLERLAQPLIKTQYGAYLLEMAQGCA